MAPLAQPVLAFAYFKHDEVSHGAARVFVKSDVKRLDPLTGPMCDPVSWPKECVFSKSLSSTDGQSSPHLVSVALMSSSSLGLLCKVGGPTSDIREPVVVEVLFTALRQVLELFTTSRLLTQACT